MLGTIVLTNKKTRMPAGNRRLAQWWVTCLNFKCGATNLLSGILTIVCSEIEH